MTSTGVDTTKRCAKWLFKWDIVIHKSSNITSYKHKNGWSLYTIGFFIEESFIFMGVSMGKQLRSNGIYTMTMAFVISPWGVQKESHSQPVLIETAFKFKVPSGKLTVCELENGYLVRWFTHKKLWFSIAM
jgi:hypothetical protein